jgi:hypothetical protein
MMSVYSERALGVAGLVFFVAFVLTCWPCRWTLVSAGILYVIGVLTNLGILAFQCFQGFAINWGTSDSPPQSFPLIGWLLPAWVLGYAVAASVLLLPYIPQQKAILLGRILHLVVLPLLVVFLLVGPLYQFQRMAAHSLSWLVYGLLWFRIRERYRDRIHNT